MLDRNVNHRYRRIVAGTSSCGFTLIELLTSVAIIAILIAVLVPSIARARIEAKRTATRGLLRSIASGAEMFRNETNKYPESRRGLYYRTQGDPDGPAMNGAMKIARALMGREAYLSGPTGSVHPEKLRESTNPVADFYSNPDPQQRMGAFMENAAPDRDFVELNVANWKVQGVPLPPQPPAVNLPRSPPPGSPEPAPMVFIDTFRFPILYFRSEGRGDRMAQDVRGGQTGYYYKEDNLEMLNWQFTGPHPMATFGDPVNPHTIQGSFCDAVHVHSGADASGTQVMKERRKPKNADSFLLISAGPDGLYGTPDDVTN